MKKLTLYIISIFAFLFISTSKVEAQTYDGILGYDYSSSYTRFFYLNNTGAQNIKLYIDEVLETDMAYDQEANIWYSSVDGDLKGKEYYYEVCYEDLTCINTIDAFSKHIDIDRNRNVVIDSNFVYIDGYSDLKTGGITYDSAIYAIEPDKFVQNLTVDTTVEEEEEIEIPGVDIGQTQPSPEEYKDSIFNRLRAKAKHGDYATGFNYLISMNIKNIEMGNLYDDNNYFSPNQLFSTKENNYSAILELKNLILNYKNNKLNVISRMELLTPGDELKQMLLNIDGNAVLENGKINLQNEYMKKYILEVYKYWVNEYKIDGFYIVDADDYGSEYLNKLVAELKTINSNLFVYTDSSSLGEYKTNDDLQNILMGKLSDANNEGILHGNYGKENFQKLIQAMYSGFYNDASKADQSYKVINNIGSFNDLDIYSKLMLVSGLSAKESEIINKATLFMYTVFSSAGIPRLISGNEFLNTTTISSSQISTFPNDAMVCNLSKTLCYAKGDFKTINWEYLVKNQSNVSKMTSYRRNYTYQYPNYLSMRVNENIILNEELFDKGILYLTIEYNAKRKGDIEKSIVIINYSGLSYDIGHVSNKDYSKVLPLIGRITNAEESTTIHGYTFFTLTELKRPKFSNIVYILIVAGLLGFIFGIRYLLIWLLKNKKGIDYKEYNNEQKIQRKLNKENNTKPVKGESLYETYLKDDSLINKMVEKITRIGKRKKKEKKTNESKNNVDKIVDNSVVNEENKEKEQKEENKND